MTRYGMVVDLASCTGCNTCTMTCKIKNGTPPGVFWRTVLEQEVGTFPTVRRVFLPLNCNHCGEPPCAEVCPTGATQKRPDGIVTIDSNDCIGCEACVVACPYGVRYFNDSAKGYFNGKASGGTLRWPLQGKEQPKRVASKCDFCVDLVEQGQQPACVRNCPPGALHFGDLDDPNSNVSRLIASKGGRQLLREKGTNPSVYYIS